MTENQTKMSPKMTFILGLVGGIAIISTIGFFSLLPKIYGEKDEKVLGSNTNANPSPSATAQEPVPQLASIPEISASDYIRGDKNAKITMVEYSDFECPFCLRHNPTIDKILSEYKGKVRLIYRHFPLSFHPQAQKAAEAFECAGEQGKAYEMHDKIYQANAAANMSIETWKKTAKDLGLNTSKFNDCLDTGKYASKISQQQNDGAAAGVEGTPATFINGKLVSGAVPYEQFKSIIDVLL
ncbi:MAG: hypothetical protein US74_C0041G0010 [Parcubacteria group bacterium GW2011_GWA2_38_13]|nr:MAG: hypothetical protein US74_C0041G0010 [Parcubacteria group bacterium GW2011_GWA2_38_13]